MVATRTPSVVTRRGPVCQIVSPVLVRKRLNAASTSSTTAMGRMDSTTLATGTRARASRPRMQA